MQNAAGAGEEDILLSRGLRHILYTVTALPSCSWRFVV